jgi:hypothetical protein
VKFKNNKTTNVIICTGSTGDLDQSAKEETIKALTDKQVKMFFIQLVNKGGSVYDQYLTDSKDLMVETAKAIDAKFFAKEIKSGKDKKSDWSCSAERCELINSAVPGALYQKSRGGVFSANEVKDYIGKLLRSNENALNNLLAQNGNDNAIKSHSLTTEQEASIKELKIMYKTMGFTERDIDNYLSGNTYKLFIEGWASTSHNKVKSEIFIKNLFLSKSEFERIYRDIGSVANGGGTASEDKVSIYNAFKSIIKAYKGGDISDSKFNSYDIKDLMLMITNLPVNNKIFDENIGGILKEKDDNKVLKIKSAFKVMYEKLKRVKNDKNCKYVVDENEFYWVPEKTFSIDS